MLGVELHKIPRYKIKRAHKVIRDMLTKHGRIRVVFADFSQYTGYSGSQRRRILTKDGYSKVAYKGIDHKKFSGYMPSCFMGNRKEKTLKETLKCMRKHDGFHIVPIEIHYGWFFMKKIVL